MTTSFHDIFEVSDWAPDERRGSIQKASQLKILPSSELLYCCCMSEVIQERDGLLQHSVRPCIRLSHMPFRFDASFRMSVSKDRTVVRSVERNAWAQVSTCAIEVGFTVRFSFKILKGDVSVSRTCCGIAPAGCTDRDSGFYLHGSDVFRFFPQLGVQSVISFCVDPSAGKMHASVDGSREVLLVDDPHKFKRRTFFPSIFTYGVDGPVREVELLWCERTRGTSQRIRHRRRRKGQRIARGGKA